MAFSFDNSGDGKVDDVNTPPPRIDQAAVASLVTAIVGVIVCRIVGGWAALLAATLSLVLGFLALSFIRRTERKGRWAAIVGIGFGVVVYGTLIVYIAWDLIDPVKLNVQ